MQLKPKIIVYKAATRKRFLQYSTSLFGSKTFVCLYPSSLFTSCEMINVQLEKEKSDAGSVPYLRRIWKRPAAHQRSVMQCRQPTLNKYQWLIPRPVGYTWRQLFCCSRAPFRYEAHELYVKNAKPVVQSLFVPTLHTVIKLALKFKRSPNETRAISTISGLHLHVFRVLSHGTFCCDEHSMILLLIQVDFVYSIKISHTSIHLANFGLPDVMSQLNTSCKKIWNLSINGAYAMSTYSISEIPYQYITMKFQII